MVPVVERVLSTVLHAALGTPNPNTGGPAGHGATP